MMVTHDSVHLTVKLINVWPSVRTLPPFLCQCLILRVFKAQATRMRGKAEQELESLRIELGTSSTEGSALTNCATPAPTKASSALCHLGQHRRAQLEEILPIIIKVMLK